MKKFLKILAAMAALVLALACFAGCKNDNDEDVDSENTVTPTKKLSDEWSATVEGGSLKFSFYDDSTFEYKETIGEKSGEISGTYAIDNARAVAYGKYILTIKKVSGDLSYAKDLKEGGTMTVSISEDKNLIVEGIEVVFKNPANKDDNQQSTDDKQNDDQEDYTVEGPWGDVTSLNDLVGNWIHKSDEVGEGVEERNYAGKTYSGKWIEKCRSIYEWKISSEGSCKHIVKAGNYEIETFIFSTPITNDEVAAIQAELDKEIEEESEPHWKEIGTVTNTERIYGGESIEDYEGNIYTLKLEGGKCYMYRDNDKYRYVKINEAKNGIQVFRNDPDSQHMYTLKKQQ